jgi:hypothetical protein
MGPGGVPYKYTSSYLSLLFPSSIPTTGFRNPFQSFLHTLRLMPFMPFHSHCVHQPSLRTHSHGSHADIPRKVTPVISFLPSSHSQWVLVCLISFRDQALKNSVARSPRKHMVKFKGNLNRSWSNRSSSSQLKVDIITNSGTKIIYLWEWVRRDSGAQHIALRKSRWSDATPHCPLSNWSNLFK